MQSLDKTHDIVENDFISILLHHTELLKSTVVERAYFDNETLGLIFSLLKECETFDAVLFTDKGFEEVEFLMNVYDRFIFETSYYQMFKSYETKIINHYKTKCLNELNLRLAKRQIDYNSYKEEFDKIDEIRPLSTKEHPTEKELIEAITSHNRIIDLGKFNNLGKILKLESDDLVTVSAPPNFGKTPFLLNVFNECLNNKNNYCQYYNLEVNRNQIIKRLIAIESKETINSVCSYKRSPKENISKAIKKYGSSDYYLNDEPMAWERMQAEIISHLKKDKQNIVFIDYLGLIGLRNSSYNRTNYDKITYIMKELRKLCRKYNVLVFIASQCNRSALNNGVLTMHSLKDSGEVENSSTHVILLYEDQNREKEFELIKNITADIAKNRNNYTFKMPMTFVGEKQLFEESRI